MKNTHSVVGCFVSVLLLGGCVAAKCRDGSHSEGSKCVADDRDSGQSGSGGTGGASGNDGDSGLDTDAGSDASDVNECATDNGGCDPLTACVNTIGAHECGACPSGYSGDGNSGCVDVDECITDNGGCDTEPMVACTNNVGGRMCGACPPGYTGDGVGDGGCVDIDECATNNGGCDVAATCSNLPGSFSCGACPAGYTGSGGQTDGCVAQLSSLRAKPGLSSASFNAATLAYSMTVGLMARYVEVIATTLVAGATVSVDGEPVDSHDSRFAWIGSGSATVLVTLTDAHARVRTYTLTVSRESNAVQRSYVKALLPTQYEAFGRSIATDGDTLVVGGSGPQESSVSVFGRDGTTWALQTTITSAFYGYYPALGRDAVDVDGDTLVIGQSDYAADGTNLKGGVLVYVRSGGIWTKQATLLASNAEIDDGFGKGVAISGDRIAVGAPGEDSGDATNPDSNTASGSGAVYIFSRTGTTWTQDGYVKSNNIGVDDAFGGDVDLDRDTLLVGAPGEDGAGWGINPGTDNGRSNSGAGYVYTRDSNGAWNQDAYVKNDESTATTDASFGFSVALGNETHAVIGAPGASGGQGRAFVFQSTAPGAWSQLSALAPYDADLDGFGISVAMWGPGAVVVSAHGDDSSATAVNGIHNNAAEDSGASYAFLRASSSSSSQFTSAYYLKALNAEAGDGTVQMLPNVVAVAGDSIVTTAPREDSNVGGVQSPGPSTTTDDEQGINWDSGAVYIFR